MRYSELLPGSEPSTMGWMRFHASSPEAQSQCYSSQSATIWCLNYMPGTERGSGFTNEYSLALHWRSVMSVGGDRHTLNTAGVGIEVGRCTDTRVSDYLKELRKAGWICPWCPVGHVKGGDSMWQCGMSRRGEAQDAWNAVFIVED